MEFVQCSEAKKNTTSDKSKLIIIAHFPYTDNDSARTSVGRCGVIAVAYQISPVIARPPIDVGRSNFPEVAETRNGMAAPTQDGEPPINGFLYEVSWRK